MKAQRLASPRRGRGRKYGAAVAMATALLTFTVACSDGSSSAESGEGDQQQVADAKAATEQAEAPITTIGDYAPLTTKPVAGQTFVWMSCDLSACKQQTDGAQKAAESIGWNFKTVNYSLADPASLVSGLKQALQYNPVAVGTGSLQGSQFDAVIPDYEKAGVVISNSFSDTAPTGPIISNLSGPAYSAMQGDMISNWFVADSDGNGKALMVTVDSVTGLRAFTDQVTKKVEEACSACTLTPVPLSYADVAGGNLASSVVAQLQRDPSIEYVILPQGTFAAGLSSALAAAGLSGKVKIAGQAATVANLDAIKNGSETAWLSANTEFGGWQAIDSVLRHQQSLEFDTEAGGPVRLLTKEQEFPIAESLPEPAGYQDQFKKLWLVS